MYEEKNYMNKKENGNVFGKKLCDDWEDQD
jgi:hypothetical protein